MSAVQNSPVWHKSESNSKHEKCRHITEEIYKRIDITFQIKSLETGCVSDASNGSDQIDIDSNELSNGTDLFAYDKSDSISSSVSEQGSHARLEKSVNVNNNEIRKSVVPIYRRPKKRFRKRIKKRQTKDHRTDSEGSSDEVTPLSRIIVDPPGQAIDNVMGVPKITILTSAGVARIKEAKPRSPEKKAPSTVANTAGTVTNTSGTVGDTAGTDAGKGDKVADKASKESEPKGRDKKEPKQCSMCSLTCRGERGLRRHMALSHILIPEAITRPLLKKQEPRFEALN